MKNGGFTLIELLVVVAIIGLLVTFVLVNTQKTRFQAHDAQIQSLMHQLRNAAEMNYMRTETYAQVCDELDKDTLSNSGEFGILELAIMKENKNRDVKCFESSDKRDFAAFSPLVAKQDKWWCVESAGLSIEVDHVVNSGRCQ